MLSNTSAIEPIVPELLTLKQAADLCNVSERTLWNWARAGISPAPIKFGRSRANAVRYSRAAYMAWIADGCKPMCEEKTGSA